MTLTSDNRPAPSTFFLSKDTVISFTHPHTSYERRKNVFCKNNVQRIAKDSYKVFQSILQTPS